MSVIGREAGYHGHKVHRDRRASVARAVGPCCGIGDTAMRQTDGQISVIRRRRLAERTHTLDREYRSAPLLCKGRYFLFSVRQILCSLLQTGLYSVSLYLRINCGLFISTFRVFLYSEISMILVIVVILFPASLLDAPQWYTFMSFVP